jgi:hypothetical protein
VQVAAVGLFSAHGPLHARRLDGAEVVAVSVTTVPAGKLAVHVGNVPAVLVQLIPAGLDVTVPNALALAPFIDSVSVCIVGVNVAVTLRAVFISTVQLPVPEHAPDHPANVFPGLGAAVSVTTAPALNADVHVPGQLIEPGADDTVPPPTVDTESWKDTFTNVAVTDRAALIVTVHVGDVPLHAPPQPPNVCVALVVAVSVTIVPCV